jgi:hypothetical protein
MTSLAELIQKAAVDVQGKRIVEPKQETVGSACVLLDYEHDNVADIAELTDMLSLWDSLSVAEKVAFFRRIQEIANASKIKVGHRAIRNGNGEEIGIEWVVCDKATGNKIHTLAAFPMEFGTIVSEGFFEQEKDE